MLTEAMAKKCLRRELALSVMRALENTQLPVVWRFQSTMSNMRKHIASHWIPDSSGLVTCSTNYGFNVIINPAIDKGVEQSIYRTGTYEAGTMNVFRHLLRTGDTFVDIGANIGLMSLYAAKLVGNDGKVYAFEPVEEIYELLLANIELNDYRQITAINVALGSVAESRKIFSHPEINRGSSSLLEGDHDGDGEAEIVTVDTLDSFTSAHIKTPIRLIKIDVEGWELEVIRGATHVLSRHDAPAICVECSTAHALHGGNIADLYQAIMRSNDYQCFRLRGGKSVKSPLQSVKDENDLPEHDNLFFVLPHHNDSLQGIIPA